MRTRVANYRCAANSASRAAFLLDTCGSGEPSPSDSQITDTFRSSAQPHACRAFRSPSPIASQSRTVLVDTCRLRASTATDIPDTVIASFNLLPYPITCLPCSPASEASIARRGISYKRNILHFDVCGRRVRDYLTLACAVSHVCRTFSHSRGHLLLAARVVLGAYDAPLFIRCVFHAPRLDRFF